MVAPYSALYAEINNGAHHKAADLIGAPALIWHQTLWTPVHDEKSRADRAKRLERYIKALHKKLAGAGVTPENPDELRISPNDRARVITLNFQWQGMQSKIRFEVHSEYITITSILDLSLDLSTPLNSSITQLSRDYPQYRSVKKHFNALCDYLISRSNSTGPTASDHIAIPIHKYLYEQIWDNYFDPDLLANMANYFVDAAPLKRIADFRGIITCEKYNPKGPDFDLSSPTFVSKHSIQPAFYKKQEGLRDLWQRTAAPNEEWARARLNAAWPFLTAAEEHLPGRLEFTVSRLLEGRVIYVSALGPQSEQTRLRPLFFYLHSATQCERQIGRLVDRLCQLGTLRLAAILVLPALKEIVERLRNLESKLNSTRAEVHQLICKTDFESAKSTVESQERIKIAKTIAGELANIQSEISDISSGTESQNKDLGSQTLEFRLERSSYYKDQFYSLVKDIRAFRLEGYQPYPEFVNRRLRGAFGYIEGFSQRIQGIRSNWRALDQLYLAATVTALTAEIEVSQDREGHIQNDIRELQAVGELALFFVLAPYYIFNVFVKDIFGCGVKDACEAKLDWGFGDRIIHSTTEQIAAIIVFIFCTIMYFVIRGKKLASLFRTLKERFNKPRVGPPPTGPSHTSATTTSAQEGLDLIGKTAPDVLVILPSAPRNKGQSKPRSTSPG